MPLKPSWSIFRATGGMLGLLTAILSLEAGCKPAGAPAAMAPPKPLVMVASAVTRDVPVYLDEIGKCTARENVTISPQIAGRLTEIHFTDGCELKKDELLFVIDPRPFKAALDQVNAQLAQDNAALDFARLELKRDEELLLTKAIAQSDYDTKKNAVEVGIARVQADVAMGETAKLNLEYCYIKSPIDGRAGQRLVDNGNVVKANDTALLVIQRLDPIYADFTITERELPIVQQEMARGTLKASASLQDDTQPPRAGDLTFLDNAVQDGTGTVKLRATLPNTDHHFWPGQYVNVRLVLSVKKDAVLVPTQATQLGQKGPYVYVIGKDSKAALRPIVPGQLQGDMVVVDQGVAAGELVVTNGQIGVLPGGEVTITPPPAADAAAPKKTSAGPGSGPGSDVPDTGSDAEAGAGKS